MGTKVAKFGGSSLADAAAFRQVASIIKADPQRRYVVASAPGKRFDGDEKVTDMLYRCYDLAAAGKAPGEVFARIAKRYEEIISDLGLEFSLQADLAEIEKQTVADPQRDFLASRGEYLNAKLLAAYLGFGFVDPAEGIFFTDAGVLDEQRSYETLGGLLQEHEYAVIPGFYGMGTDGRVRTFSRGGSDVTGAVVARAAGAELYENWTDVSGMLMADPRCVENPEPISVITYRELRELTYMGATVLHDEAVFPARGAKIPINIRNTRRPQDEGTWIVAGKPEQAPPYLITGVAGRKGFASITVEKDRLNSEIGFGRRILTVLEDKGISFEHLPTGIDTISVFVQQADIAGREEELVAEISTKTQADSITIEGSIALIAVVGRGMVGTVGPACRLFTAVESKGIHIKMIDQGSSGLNIILGVDEADYERTINAIYQEFVK